MVGLMMRDLTVLGKRFWVPVLFCLMGPFILRLLGQATMVVVVLGTAYVTLFLGMEYEGKYNVDATMVSLPVTREQLVIARYMEIPILTAAAMLAYMLVTGLCPWLSASYPSGWTMPALAFLAIAILCGLHLPVVFRIGCLKAKVISAVIILAGFVLPMNILGVLLIRNPQLRASIENISGMIPGLMAAVAVMILFISCVISVRLYRKRQF